MRGTPYLRRRVSALVAIGLGLLFALAPASESSAIQIGGPFELVDQDGGTRTDADFRGSYMLIFFGYTYCPDLCPTTLQEVAGALEEFAALAPAEAGRVVPIFVSVDPQRDTPEVLRGYVEAFHPRLVGLTGTRAALAKVGRRYGAVSARSPMNATDDYLVDHTSFVYLMGPDGKYIEHFESDAGVGDFVAALQRNVVAPTAGGS